MGLTLALSGGSASLVASNAGGLAVLLRAALASAVSLPAERVALTGVTQSDVSGEGPIRETVPLNATSGANAGASASNASVAWRALRAAEGRELQTSPLPDACAAARAAGPAEGTTLALRIAIDLADLLPQGSDPSAAAEVIARVNAALASSETTLGAFAAAWSACTGASENASQLVRVMSAPTIAVGPAPSLPPVASTSTGMTPGAVAATTVIVIFTVFALAVFALWYCAYKRASSDDATKAAANGDRGEQVAAFVADVFGKRFRGLPKVPAAAPVVA